MNNSEKTTSRSKGSKEADEAKENSKIQTDLNGISKIIGYIDDEVRGVDKIIGRAALRPMSNELVL
jgi:hypothetical protein